ALPILAGVLVVGRDIDAGMFLDSTQLGAPIGPFRGTVVADCRLCLRARGGEPECQHTGLGNAFEECRHGMLRLVGRQERKVGLVARVEIHGCVGAAAQDSAQRTRCGRVMLSAAEGWRREFTPSSNHVTAARPISAFGWAIVLRRGVRSRARPMPSKPVMLMS